MNWGMGWKRERSHRTTREVGEGIGPAITHGYEPEVRQRILVEKFPDEGLQVERNDRRPCGPHVGYSRGLGKVHYHLHIPENRHLLNTLENTLDLLQNNMMVVRGPLLNSRRPRSHVHVQYNPL
jgi:hypothetical protein